MCQGHAGQGTQVSPPRPILRDMVNERAVHILLECILVIYISYNHNTTNQCHVPEYITDTSTVCADPTEFLM